jgi:hypothetical protein
VSEDTRRDARRSASPTGWITIEGSAIRHGCAVSNLSAGGARIEFPRARRLPDQFYLLMGDERAGRLCRTVWRQGRRVGVAFQSAE